MVAITCRKMDKNDVLSVYEIERTVQDGWSLSVIENLFDYANNKCYVALIDNEIACFCCFEHILDTANLNAISTSVKHRRKGIAKALLLYAIKELAADKAQIFWLEVRSKNSGAINLYENLGFKQNGFRKNYYTNPKDDAVLYGLNLSVEF